MNRPAVRMLGVIAVFGVLCLTLITWAELRWRATLIDTYQPERLIGEVRMHLQSAELQVARNPYARASASVDGALDNAYLASTALLDQMRQVRDIVQPADRA